MRVLIVGAGSIGQLYGYFLQRGGAAVHVFVRPKYKEDAQRGFHLYERKKGLTDPVLFKPDQVLTEVDELQDQPYRAVILAIPSDGLRQDWFDDFTKALGHTTLVSLSPALEDQLFLENFSPKEQIINGLITAISYPAPMEGEEAEKGGTAYWFPPLTPAFFDGEDERLTPLLGALNRGGMTARKLKGLTDKAAFATALLMPAVATLETVGWSFKALRKSRERRRLLVAAAKETLAITETLTGKKRPLPMRLLSPAPLAMGLLFAPIATPFDLERYVQTHFTKVGPQTRLYLADYIRERTQNGDLKSPALEQLLQEITEAAPSS